jgi:O-antigen ligase
VLGRKRRASAIDCFNPVMGEYVTTMHALPQTGKTNRSAFIPAPIPPSWVEYTYYLSLLYSILGARLGLEIPLLGGGFVLLLAAICVLQLRSCATRVYAPIALLLACASSYVLVQVVIHDESLIGENLRGFILGILQLIIVSSLCLRRGFYLRFPLFLFAVGAMALPFLTFNLGDVERASVDSGVVQGSVTHPNGMGEWFGFLAVYFAVIGLQTKRSLHRVGAWLLTAGCLLVVGLAVSRGPLFGAALAITFAFRGVLKRGFMPVFVLVILVGVLSLSGLFDAAVSHYSERAMEKSGREVLWPAAIDRISMSPIFGVGASKVGLYVLSAKDPSPPHNSFLFFALSAGVLPFVFYVAFWVQLAWRSAMSARRGREGDSFRMPYLLFTFVSVMLGDLPFMALWGLLAVSVAAGSAVVYEKQRFIVTRVGNKTKIGLLSGLRSPETSTGTR